MLDRMPLSTLPATALVLLLGTGIVHAQETGKITAEVLAGKSFRFSWRQGTEGGFNGTLLLRADGRIIGIQSANETSWRIDEEGRLLFLHEDGRVSTTYAEARVEEERFYFDGPFHFREGITHHLEETTTPPPPPAVELTEGLPERLLFTTQTLVCLDPDEEYVFALASGREVTVRLLSVTEHRDTVVDLIRRADVRVAIDGEEHDLRCAPYVMPTVIGGLRIQADTTSGFTVLPKRVQFSLWDATAPIVDAEKFDFPLRDFRLFSHGIQCYNEPVHLGRGDGDPAGAVFHHSYGIDFAGYEGGEDVVACVAGEVVRLVRDGIQVNVVDDAGLIWEYHHLDSIAPHLEVGRRVKKGEKLGVLGRSGPSGNFSHLHVGAFLSPAHMDAGRYTRRLNWYPWMVAAYRTRHPDGPLAVAGPHRPVRVGEEVPLDASDSLPGKDAIVSFRWMLPDATEVDGPRATWVPPAPGIFHAILYVTDAAGNEDVAFAKIKAYSKGAAEEMLPAFFVTSTPTENVFVGEPVRFRIWLHGAEEESFLVTFGDGSPGREVPKSFEVFEHAYEAPGTYIANTHAMVDGVLSTGRQKIVVRASPTPREREPVREAAAREAIVRDWMLQDYMAIELPPELDAEKEAWRAAHLSSVEARDDAPVLESLSCFVSESDAVVEARMVEHVVDEIGPAGSPWLDAAEELLRDAVPGRDPRWRALYLFACEARRDGRLHPLYSRWPRIVFDQHVHVPGSWKYTEGLSDAQAYRYFTPGAKLELLEMNGPYGRVRTLLEDRDGILRNPDVSYDGERILFAWKKSDRGDDFHLYEMDVATREVRQLTHGLGLADYEGAYLPDGNVVFSSTRCIQTVDCNWVEVSNLYTMDGDGRYLRRLGFDQVHTIFPTVTDDGRVLYTRWDYNDRAQIYTQPLFQMYADGTNQREFYGGSSWFPTNIIHARQIPGSREVAAIVTGHHTPAHGKLAIIDPAAGRQEGRGIRMISPVREADPVRVDVYGMQGFQYQYPYPLDESRFLVTLALPTPEGKLGRFNVYLVDVDGGRELLAEGDESGEGMGCRQMVPLAPRDVGHVRPSVVDYEKDTGTVFLQDVYEGQGLEGIPRGTIDRLRVVELAYRAAGVGHAQQEGAGGFADVSSPVAVGNGSWDVKVVHGSAKVHEDGSAFFEVPARKPLYFQALDRDGFAVQTMRSWTTLMPGETQSCVGCHEHKNSVPRAQRARPLALADGPQELTPFYGPARGFSYSREVQPILDRHCVECHDGREDVPYDLSGTPVLLAEAKRRIPRSYLELTHTENERGAHSHPLVNWIDCMSAPEMLPPDHRGSRVSGLMTLLKNGHEDVVLNAEELEKIACWIDLLVPYCGDYLENHAWTADELAFYGRFAAKRARQEELERAGLRALIEQQRAGGTPPDPRDE